MKQGRKLVSVMIPSYQHEKYIEEAIESVLNQTYTELELLIADDGSTDKTVENIRKYDDDRIRLFEFSQNTCFKTWDVLRDHVKGEYVAYLGSDDIMEKTKLEKQVEFLEQNKEYDACFTWAKGIDEESNWLIDGSIENCFNVENRTREQWINQLTLQNNCIVAPSMLMKNQVFQKLGGFRMDYRQIPDWDLWIRFLQKHQFYILPEELTYYRVHPDGENANVSTIGVENNIRMNYEHAYMITDSIKNMDSLLFKTVYQENLVRKDATGEVEIECEKFFWMMNHFNVEIQTLGIHYYRENILRKEFADCMNNIYKFDRNCFFKMETEKGTAKALYDAQVAERQSAEFAEKAIAYLEKLNRE